MSSVTCQTTILTLTRPGIIIPVPDTETHSHRWNKYKLHQPDIIALCKLSFVSVNDCCCGCATLNRNRIWRLENHIDCQLNVQKENLYCSRKSFLLELYCIWRLCCSGDRQGGVGDGPPGTSTTIPASRQSPDQCGRQPAWGHIMGQGDTTFHGCCHFSCFLLYGFYLEYIFLTQTKVHIIIWHDKRATRYICWSPVMCKKACADKGSLFHPSENVCACDQLMLVPRVQAVYCVLSPLPASVLSPLCQWSSPSSLQQPPASTRPVSHSIGATQQVTHKHPLSRHLVII